ncbi:membrane-bound serine protease [Thioalkalivibrio nitratireducens DSM 14787]|uniref:Membrane-bound serine protease n=1 Tax=Thioalkalivibrio nitratireducens (strain DSM 14787 / UNIQEM 213 / ALEN2) TaxID=1255043 RepID=L0DZG3_THIND|nr:nodulation protein NfeD [Thioalkalivibrio nitratireducens]AGA34428.1 membrane-bound serine protease [Thioalkalivibrio nitratireducens DSM 14787]
MRVLKKTPILRWILWATCLAFAAGWLLAASGDEEDRPQALLLTVADSIGPATGDYIIRGIARAEREDAELMVLQLDTPGGLDSSMRDIVKAMLAADVPVVTYVHPAGARAASAGTYMMYGSHVAAMTPATNLGSATPVQMGGGGFPGMDDGGSRPSRGDDRGNGNDDATNGDDAQETDANGAEANDEEVDEDKPRRGETAMERKVLEDAVAYIRGLAERFDRNADWAELAVREGVNLTAREALEKNVIEFVADNLDDLLEQLHGHSVRMPWGDRVLNTENIEVITVDPDWRTNLLAVITSPNIAYILMLIGIYGIIFELSNPGSIYPGVIGAISLVLAFYALQVMPVNYAGLALILLGLIFMVAEAFLPSFGVLGIGGIIAFITGSIILWDDPNLNISLPLVVGTALVVAVFSIWVLGRLFRLRRVRPTIGRDHMVGMVGEAREDFDHSGRVFVHSELWTAETTAPVERGQKVRVVAVEGLRLKVEPVAEESADAARPAS